MRKRHITRPSNREKYSGSEMERNRLGAEGNVTGIREGDKREQMEKGSEGKAVMGGVVKQRREQRTLEQPVLRESWIRLKFRLLHLQQMR